MAEVQAQVAQNGVNGNSVDGGAAGAANLFPTISLYVGDLEHGVTDAQLYDIFGSIGQVVSVRVCRDVNTKRSLGYGYVNYSNTVDAARAIDSLNFTPLNGKPIRIMHSNRDPSTRKSGQGNIFIKNLDKSIDHKALHETFSIFGNILSCKVATDSSGQSKGYGFVQFESDEAARSAIEKLNGMCLNDKPVYVGRFLRKQERDNAGKFTNVFVKNLAESTTKEELDKIFGEYGNITSSVLMIEDGKSKCFGFVNFENPNDAARAVQELNGKKFGDKEWFVGKAQKKSEREMELKVKFDQGAKEAVEKFQGVNLYLKNLDDNISDENLREMFSAYGTITSCKVIQDPNGVSRGSGFVAFSSPDEASRALVAMNGKMVGNKPLYVAFAQRKEERRAQLQAQFSQNRPVVMPPNAGPRMPMYPSGSPAISQPLFYGQAPPVLIPQPSGFGYQQPLAPGMRPSGAPMHNFFVPMAQHGQRLPRPTGRRAAGVGVPVQSPHHPMFTQPMLPRGGRVYRYAPPGPNVASSGPMLPPDISGLSLNDPQPMPIGALATALANSTPEQRRTMLGENLYPLVDKLEHESAAKVTGMLLEMDQTEVLHLLESPEALKAKVGEALDVLRSVH